MKIALISDIHGNAMALDAILQDIEQIGIDRLVCLGDVAAAGLQPNEAIQWIKALECPVVMGNTDAWLINPQIPEGKNKEVIENNRWCAAQLSEENRSFLSTFKPIVKVALDDHQSLLCFHGSPQSYHDVIVATTPDDELNTYFSETTASILVGGHTHVPLVRRWGTRFVINPGSVGLPCKTPPQISGSAQFLPHSEYAIITLEKEQPNIELRRVPLDLQALFHLARTCGMPHPQAWINLWET